MFKLAFCVNSSSLEPEGDIKLVSTRKVGREPQSYWSYRFLQDDVTNIYYLHLKESSKKSYSCGFW